MIDKKLVDLNGSVDELEESFTFVTDCASAMPAVPGASVSPHRVPYSKCCVGCFSHQLNTAIKVRSRAFKM